MEKKTWRVPPGIAANMAGIPPIPAQFIIGGVESADGYALKPQSGHRLGNWGTGYIELQFRFLKAIPRDLVLEMACRS